MAKEEQINLDEALRSWENLNAVIARMTQRQVRAAITLEEAGRNRETYLTRLRQRLRAAAAEEVRE